MANSGMRLYWSFCVLSQPSPIVLTTPGPTPQALPERPQRVGSTPSSPTLGRKSGVQHSSGNPFTWPHTCTRVPSRRAVPRSPLSPHSTCVHTASHPDLMPSRQGSCGASSCTSTGASRECLHKSSLIPVPHSHPRGLASPFLQHHLGKMRPYQRKNRMPAFFLTFLIIFLMLCKALRNPEETDDVTKVYKNSPQRFFVFCFFCFLTSRVSRVFRTFSDKYFSLR